MIVSLLLPDLTPRTISEISVGRMMEENSESVKTLFIAVCNAGGTSTGSPAIEMEPFPSEVEMEKLLPAIVLVSPSVFITAVSGAVC